MRKNYMIAIAALTVSAVFTWSQPVPAAGSTAGTPGHRSHNTRNHRRQRLSPITRPTVTGPTGTLTVTKIAKINNFYSTILFYAPQLHLTNTQIAALSNYQSQYETEMKNWNQIHGSHSGTGGIPPQIAREELQRIDSLLTVKQRTTLNGLLAGNPGGGRRAPITVITAPRNGH